MQQAKVSRPFFFVSIDDARDRPDAGTRRHLQHSTRGPKIMASKPGFGRAFIGGGLILAAGYAVMKGEQAFSLLLWAEQW